jgi:hypothetical protein
VVLATAQFDVNDCRDFIGYYLAGSFPGEDFEASQIAVPMLVSLAAVGEYMTAEVVELSGNSARDRGSEVINVTDLHRSVRNDAELVRVGLCVVGGGG